MPRKTVHTDIHCVTRWTKLDTDFAGVPIQHILELAQLKPSAGFVLAHSEQGYTTNMPLEVLDDEDVLLADTFDGQPLEPEHGWPLRLFVPSATSGRAPSGSGASSSSSHDRLGFWERYGYNNSADPLKEERYSDSRLQRGAAFGRAWRSPADPRQVVSLLPVGALPAFSAAAWARSGIGFAIGGRPASATFAT